MGAPMKCLQCDCRWYGVASETCLDCGSGDIDFDAPPSEPDARMLEMVALVKSAGGKISDADERLHQFFDDRGNGFDTYNLCIAFGIVREAMDETLECGAVALPVT